MAVTKASSAEREGSAAGTVRHRAFDVLPSPVTVYDAAAARCVYANPVALRELPAVVLGAQDTGAADAATPSEPSAGMPLEAQRSAASAVIGGASLGWPDVLQSVPGRYLTLIPGSTLAWYQLETSRLDDGQLLVVWSDAQQAVGAVAALTIAWEETAAVSALLETAIEAMTDRFVVARVTRGPEAELIRASVEHANAAAQPSPRAGPMPQTGQDVVGRDVRDVPGLADDRLWATLRAVANFGAPSVCRLEQTGPGGELQGAEDVLVSLVGEDHLVLICRDVTASVQAEHTLAQAWEETSRVRAVLQSALDSVPERFVVLAITPSADAVTTFHIETLNAAAAIAADSTIDSLIGAAPTQVYGGEAARTLVAEATVCLRHQQARRWCERQVDEAGMSLADIEHVLSPVGEELVVVTSRDITDLVRHELELQTRSDQATHAATHDPLTGLANRALLLRELRDALAETSHGQRSVLMYADLDRFKAVNDTHGHAVGDQVLVAVAERLREMTRAGDTVCRLGGDEFILLLRGIGPTWDEVAFVARAERAIAVPITCAGPTDGTAKQVGVGATFGVYDLDDSSQGDADHALEIADARMYARKATRRH